MGPQIGTPLANLIGMGTMIGWPTGVAWAALSVKYTDTARDNEDDKTPKLSVQRIFTGLYSSTEKFRSANEYCTTNDVRWAHVSLILHCGGGPVD